jgi:hypothetical protein
MKPLASPKTRSIADVLSPDEAQTFLDLVRIAQQRAEDETLEIRDEKGMIWGCLWFLECHASPNDPPTDPEFLKELERRLQSPQQVIPYEDGDDLFDEDEEPE